MGKDAILYKLCTETGYKTAEQAFYNALDCWKEQRGLNIPDLAISELVSHYGMWIGFPSKDDVLSNFVDQTSECLFGDNQADVIPIDKNVFEEFDGENYWQVLDKYLGDDSADKVLEAFDKGAEQFFNKYFREFNHNLDETLVCNSQLVPLELTCSISTRNIEEFNMDSLGVNLQDIIGEILSEDIEPIVLKNVCRPLGIVNGEELGNEVIDTLYDIVKKELDGNLYIVREGCEKEPIPSEWIIETVVDYYNDSSAYAKIVGQVIIQCLTMFFNHGKWHTSMNREEEPLIWFGLEDSAPIDIWTLPFESDKEYTSWKTIWFRDFWALDWNAILGGYDNFLTVWMFAEYGMEEPEFERDNVREKCPILLTEEDTIQTIKEKIHKLIN